MSDIYLFSKKDVEVIIKIKPVLNMKDSYAWAFSKSGLYDTQSGYRLLENLPVHRDNSIPPLPPIEKPLWLKLWKIKNSPKIKHFLWKYLASTLAVADRRLT